MSSLSGGHRERWLELGSKWQEYLRGDTDELGLQVRLDSCQEKQKVSKNKILMTQKNPEIGKAVIFFLSAWIIWRRTYFLMSLLLCRSPELLLACSTSRRLPLWGFQGRGTQAEKPGCWWHPWSCSPWWCRRKTCCWAAAWCRAPPTGSGSFLETLRGQLVSQWEKNIYIQSRKCC